MPEANNYREEMNRNSLLASQVSIEEEVPDNNNSHDDFLEQILSTFPNCSWPPQPHSQPSHPNPALLPASSPPLEQTNSLGGEDGSLQALYNGFTGSLHANAPPPDLQQFNPPPAVVSTGARSGGAAPQRQRVRARRGQATDPHSIAERIRRERIAERMKGLQELVPNGNKTDKASMLDEIIDYVKFLQLQVKVLSMSRLGGGPPVAPQVADVSSEGGGGGLSSLGNQSNDNMTVTEHQVAKLMEDDLGSAMQYLQRKGLCLMPISLATAISTATCQPHNLGRTPSINDHSILSSNAGEPTTNMSGLTVQSAIAATKNTINNASK